MLGLKKKAKLEVRATAQMNARLQPMHRGHFEDPLIDFLQAGKLGEVTGGGTQLADEPAGIAYCDIELSLVDNSEATLKAVIAEFERLGAPKGSKLIFDTMPAAVQRHVSKVALDETGSVPFGVHEGLGLFLNGMDLPDEVYATSDINHVIEECERLMAGNGKMLSFWEGSRDTALYFYGASFAQMKAAIAPFVASYPLCQKSRIEQIA